MVLMKTNTMMNNMARTTMVVAMTGCIALGAASGAWCEEKWKSTFDDICSKVDASSTMSAAELTSMVQRLDKLAPEVNASGDPAKKIYLQRLKKCKAMYQFMIDSKAE